MDSIVPIFSRKLSISRFVDLDVGESKSMAESNLLKSSTGSRVSGELVLLITVKYSFLFSELKLS